MRIASMLLALAISSFAAAADGEQAPTADGTADERQGNSASDEAQNPAQGADEAEEATDEPDKAAKEVFTPSEEISEDLAVPFPVDI